MFNEKINQTKIKAMRIVLYVLLFTISLNTYGQKINQISIKTGANVSGRTNANTGHVDDKQKLGFLFTIEPTLCSWGTKKQFDFNTDISFLEKGYQKKETVYTYNEMGSINGSGQEVYSFSLYYFSFSPNIKYKFSKIGFIKAGLTGDYLLADKYKGKPDSQFKGSNGFLLFGAGASFGGGVCLGEKNIKFIAELMGQKDFISSSYDSSDNTKQYYKNFSFYVNCGVSIGINKKSKE